MTPNLVLANGLQTSLSANLSSSSTSIIVASTSGIPAIGAGQTLPLTIISASSSATFEIVYATAISGTTLTVARAQEGTTAGTFSVGDYVECAPTAGTVGITGIQTLIATTSMTVTPSFMQTVVLSPSITAPITITVNAGTILGQKVTVYGSASSYPVTIAPSATSGSPYFAMVDGSKLYNWSLIGSYTGAYIDLTWDGTNWSAETAGFRIASAATQPNQTPTLSQVMRNNGLTAGGVDCNTLVTPGQYLVISPVNWTPTGFTSGLLLVTRINNEILQITSDFGNDNLWWRSSQFVTDAGFPAGVPWNMLLSGNKLLSGLSYFINNGARTSNVVYTNTSNKPMFVFISMLALTGNIGRISLYVNGTAVSDWVNTSGSSYAVINNGTYFFIAGVVPSGGTYDFGLFSTGASYNPVSPNSYINFSWSEIN